MDISLMMGPNQLEKDIAIMEYVLCLRRNNYLTF
jgi:hypothetical protein